MKSPYVTSEESESSSNQVYGSGVVCFTYRQRSRDENVDIQRPLSVAASELLLDYDVRPITDVDVNGPVKDAA